jgi:serine/threonine protein phosphatase 1
MRLARRSLPAGRRVYAVGDIHGRADLLSEMLELIMADTARRPRSAVTVLFLGDYIDRGPDSRQVIEMLIRFGETQQTICLMGNHEDAMLRFLADPLDGAQWRGFGGLETLMSYGVEIDELRLGHGFGLARKAFLAAMPDRHKEFFLSLKFCERIGGYYFCHAGVRPGVALEAQDPQDLIWIRDEFLYWPKDFGLTIVHGHTPVPHPELHDNRVNVDTGAFATGRLTCAVIEANEIGFLQTSHGI